MCCKNFRARKRKGQATKGTRRLPGRWKTKKDDQAVIEALEGLEMPNALGHAQGAKQLRKEDHSGIIDCYISRIENDELHVKKTVSRAEMAKMMPVRFDLSKMPL